MSNVQSDYQSTRRSVEDLEKDYEVQKQNLKKTAETRENRMEQNYKDGLQKNGAQAKESINEVRDQFERSKVTRDRDMKGMREEFSKQSYDRQGRVQAELRDKDKTTAALVASADEKVKATGVKEKKFEQDLNARSEKREAANQRQLEKVQESYLKETQENALSGASAKADQMKNYKQKVAETSQGAISRAQDEATAANRRSQDVAREYETRLQSTKEKYSDDADQRAERVQLTYEEKLQKAAEGETISRRRENDQLRKQVKDYSAQNKDVAQAKNEARTEVIRDLEDEYRFKNQNAMSSAEQEKSKLKSSANEQERNLNEKFEDALREKSTKNTEAMKKISNTYARELKELKDNFDHAMKSYKGVHGTEKQDLDKMYGAQRERILQQHELALRKQTDAYKADLGNERASNMTQTKLLEQTIRELKTTQDPTKVSPGVENTIRRNVETQYSKAFLTEAERNKAANDRLQEENSRRLREVRDDRDRTVVQVKRDEMADKMSIQHTLTSQLEESEYGKKEALKLAADKEERALLQTQKNMERNLNTQRLHFEDAISSRDSANEVRTKEILQETDFEKRQMRREFQTQMNLTVRDYEKKLTTQRDDYEEKLREEKDKAAFTNRDTDKRLTQIINDQAKAYERRLAELESQQKQREKLQEKIYEDELDKVKRSNALLLSKKS
jgi:hypothetical protein